MADNADDNNLDEGIEPCHDDQTTPRTPWLLWVIVFVIVTLMVIWSIRTFGTRSSAGVFPSGQSVNFYVSHATVNN